MHVSQEDVDQLNWYHTIELGGGVVTKGSKPLENIRHQADTIFKDGVAGASVLDVGAWDGAFSFEAERRGAKRVLATDYFCWAGPGWGEKACFDLARKALDSHVEDKLIDVPHITPQSVGTFDIVLFNGVFYHLMHPWMLLERLAPVATNLLVMDTETAFDDEERPVMAFFPGAELNNDPTNWWAPNIACAKAMLHHLGFARVEVTPTWPYDGNINRRRGRFTFHAWR